MLDEDGPAVPGYVFTSSQLNSAWKELDEFEGEEYERCLVPVLLESGVSVVANVYAIKQTPDI